MVGREFQAVVLAAGRGSRMTELTEDRAKCLLPVGKHPILYHTLKLLEKSKFQEAIVVVLNSAQSQIQHALSKSDLKISTELVAIPSDTSEDWGTAESLQYLISQDKIKSDIVLITCDLYTNGNLNDVLLRFRQHDACLAVLLFQPFLDPTQTEVPPGVKSKITSVEKDIIAIDSDTSRLVFLSSASDFEENVPIKKSLLQRHTKLSIRTDLVDGHVYVMSLKLAKYLTKEKPFSTLKGELLPYIVRQQHSRSSKNGQPNQDKTALHEQLNESSLDEGIKQFSSYNDHKGDLKGVYHGDNVRCYAVIADAAHFGIRINSYQSLWHANRLITTGKATEIDSAATVSSNQVEESLVGSGANVQEKTSLRSSVIGESCTVKSRSRVLRSVALRNAEIREGCAIENCVIGNDVIIGENCDLKNCIVGANHEVPKGTKASFQVLTKSDRLMEI